MKEAIAQCMGPLQSEPDGTRKTRLVFPAAFPGYQGHFPDQPVLPGICFILLVLVMIERDTGRPYALEEVVSAKFFAATAPGDPLDVACLRTGDSDDGVKVRATVHRGTERIATLALRVKEACAT